MKTIKRFLLEIEVDEERVMKLYPNYRFNFDNSEQFINFIKSDIPKKHMKSFGYNINLKKI